MGWISGTAIFFIIWWTVLFAVLPFGLRTQDDDHAVTLGTEASAPRGPHMRRAIIFTTIVAVILFGAYYYVTNVLGYSFDDLPNFTPKFD